MVMLPLKDYNPLEQIRFQYVTVTLIGICIAAFLWQLSLGSEDGNRVIYGLGMIPAVMLDARTLSPDLAIIPPSLTLLTSMFLHGGWLHLIGNMLYLWIFGDNIEDAMGHARFLIFYLLCGLVAGGAHIVANPGSTVPTVGASGAIAGVLGAYLLLHPKTRVLVLLFFRFPIRLPAYVVLGGWIVLQLISGLGERSSTGGGVAWWAHIGGFAAGLALIPLFRKRTMPLFDRPAGGGGPAGGPWGSREPTNEPASESASDPAGNADSKDRRSDTWRPRKGPWDSNRTRRRTRR